MTKGKVLAIEDDRIILRGIERFLENGDYLPKKLKDPKSWLD